MISDRTRRVALFVLATLLMITPLGAGDKKASDLSYKDLKRLVKHALLSGDEGNVRDTLERLGTIRGREPARAVLEVARGLRGEETEEYYWYLLSGVAGFRAPEASSEMGDFIVAFREKSIARDLLNVLQQQPKKTKYYNRVIRRVLEWCSLDLQLMAVDLSAQIPVRRTVDVLLKQLEKEDMESDGVKTRLKSRLIISLETLTRQRFGDSLPNWQGWWAASRDKGLAIIRLEAEDEEHTTGVVQPLDPIRAREFGAESIPPGKVLVIKAPIGKKGNDLNFDHIEAVLSRIQVPHDVVEKDRIAKKFNIKKYAAIFINCSQIHEF